MLAMVGTNIEKWYKKLATTAKSPPYLWNITVNTIFFLRREKPPNRTEASVGQHSEDHQHVTDEVIMIDGKCLKGREKIKKKKVIKAKNEIPKWGPEEYYLKKGVYFLTITIR